MFHVMGTEEATALIRRRFGQLRVGVEDVSLVQSLGRVLADDAISAEDVPPFCRSSVDGYALRAQDTFGSSESLPALLQQIGEVAMGDTPAFSISAMQCAYVPTGGELPPGSDAMVMIEHCETMGGDTVCVSKPSAPAAYVIARGDDVRQGDTVLKRGLRVRPQDIGALAALGMTHVSVQKRVKVGIISTGNELVNVETPVRGAQVRDINTHAIAAGVAMAGGEPVCYGVVRDEEPLLKEAVERALQECDVTLISGGSSVGTADMTHRILSDFGEVLIHGVAVKPGKPTIVGETRGKPAFGLPGHPVSAYFIFRLFVVPLMRILTGECEPPKSMVPAALAFNYASNHGREEYVPVSLARGKDGYVAQAVYGKAGLITTLTQADGYVRIDRDCEGLKQGEAVQVEIF